MGLFSSNNEAEAKRKNNLKELEDKRVRFAKCSPRGALSPNAA